MLLTASLVGALAGLITGGPDRGIAWGVAALIVSLVFVVGFARLLLRVDSLRDPLLEGMYAESERESGWLSQAGTQLRSCTGCGNLIQQQFDRCPICRTQQPDAMESPACAASSHEKTNADDAGRPWIGTDQF
jgi:hypothetical protein